MCNKIFILILLTLLLTLGIGSVSAFADENASYEILVKYKNSDNKLMRQGTSRDNPTEITDLGVQKIMVDSQAEYLSLLREFKANDNVLYVEPNRIYHKMQIPSELNTIEEWGLTCIQAYTAWDKTVGSSDITVAVIDSGVDLNHPDLIHQLVAGKDYVDNDMMPEDEDGHGTLVAQVVSAEANNNFGKAGVSWNSKIMPLRVLDEHGDGYVSDIAEAIIFAANHGVKIINLSLGGVDSSNVLHDAVQYANNQGTLLIAAAGNYSNTVCYPAAYDEVMAVGAINQDEEVAYFSGRGEQLALVAPGVNITGYSVDGLLITDNGTSFASPYVAGSAALIWSLNPHLSRARVRSIIESSARDIGACGWDAETGYGVLDVEEAVRQSTESLYNAGVTGFGDFDENQRIDVYDLVRIAQQVGITESDNDFIASYDINHDGIIDFLDLNIEALYYGKCYE